MKIARYALAALGLIAFLTPTAKADSFVYNVTSTEGGIDVTFALPSFQEVVTTTTFIQSTPIQLVCTSSMRAILSLIQFYRTCIELPIFLIHLRSTWSMEPA